LSDTYYKLLPDAKETLDGSSHPLVQAMCREGIFKEEHLDDLRKLSSGGQDQAYELDQFCLKLV